MGKINSKTAIILGLAAVVIVGALMLTGKSETIRELKRPDYSSADQIYSLNVEDGSDEYTVEVPVSAIKIPDDQLGAAFNKAFDAVVEAMPGDNSSLMEVRDNLVFISRAGEYGITADYTLSDYSVMNCFGEITSENIDEKGVDIVVEIELTYDIFSQTYEVPIKVLPKNYSDKELFVRQVLNAVESSNTGDEQSQYVKLPQEIDGTPVTFTSPQASKAPVIICLVLLIVVAVYYKMVIVVKKDMEKRENQMKLDYSEIVSKLSLLIGAGMSGVNALSRISSDYKKSIGSNEKKRRYAYDEILVTSNRIASGVSEIKAYTQLGQECRLHSYVKLASLMTQNIRKGGSGFTAILRAEAYEAFAERKALARKAGEEAGTKLLLPMVMMLGVVLVMIIVPAFMSF